MQRKEGKRDFINSSAGGREGAPHPFALPAGVRALQRCRISVQPGGAYTAGHEEIRVLKAGELAPEGWQPKFMLNGVKLFAWHAVAVRASPS